MAIPYKDYVTPGSNVKVQEYLRHSSIKVGGSWAPIEDVRVNDNGSWRDVILRKYMLRSVETGKKFMRVSIFILYKHLVYSLMESGTSQTGLQTLQDIVVIKLKVWLFLVIKMIKMRVIIVDN